MRILPLLSLQNSMNYHRTPSELNKLMESGFFHKLRSWGCKNNDLNSVKLKLTSNIKFKFIILEFNFVGENEFCQLTDSFLFCCCVFIISSEWQRRFDLFTVIIRLLKLKKCVTIIVIIQMCEQMFNHLINYNKNNNYRDKLYNFITSAWWWL